MSEQAGRESALQASLHWYEAVCGAHGSPGVREPSHWIHPGPVPPYHSQVVSLAEGGAAAAQLAAIRGLMAKGRGFTVKDSFGCLQLDALGFEELFRASWVARSVEVGPPSEVVGEPRWEVARSSAELERWERVWRGVPDNVDAREHEPMFPPSLLERADMAFLLGYRGDVPVATAALNSTSEAVGLSNVFSGEVDERLLFGGAVRLAGERFPGLGVVGYERGESLTATRAAGFEPVGDLTVWIWRPPT